jgi:hypothetical protein
MKSKHCYAWKAAGLALLLSTFFIVQTKSDAATVTGAGTPTVYKARLAVVFIVNIKNTGGKMGGNITVTPETPVTMIDPKSNPIALNNVTLYNNGGDAKSNPIAMGTYEIISNNGGDTPTVTGKVTVTPPTTGMNCKAGGKDYTASTGSGDGEEVTLTFDKSQAGRQNQQSMELWLN